MTLGKSFVPYSPTRIMYQVAVVFVGLFVMGLLWYGLISCIIPLSTGISSNMEQFENSTTYSSYELANTFMLNLWLFLLVIVSIGLLYWSWLYGQRAHAERGYQ
jgi:type II secretory pathway component PulF